LRRSASYDARHHHDLLGCSIKLIDALRWLAWLDLKGRGTTHTLLAKDTFGLAHSGQSFGIAGFNLPQIPGDPIIAATGHYP
jgi:hypothetical protein